MSYLICEKHSKSEKSGSKMLTNGYICMNRYCPDSFKVFCSSCKNDHRDHSAKILTIEDVSFLVDRLLKAPFREVGRVMGQTLDIMKKLKLIKEFRKKIDILQKQVQKQSLKLIDQTESLMHEYSICKESITQLSDIFTKVEQIDCFKQFAENSSQFLGNLDYNFKKDKFEYGNALIKEKQDKRRKLLQNSKRKIQQVRDYSMKIIEVILHNDDSSQGEDDIPYQKKHYQMLKSELCVDKNEQELQQEISELKNSGSTTNKSRIRRQALEQGVQTDDQLASLPLTATLNSKIDQLNVLLQQEQENTQKTIDSMSKEKQSIAFELQSWKAKYSIKLREIDQLEKKMRKNITDRKQKQSYSSQIMNRIVEYSQLKAATQQQKNQ